MGDVNEKIEESRRQFLSSCALIAASLVAESFAGSGCGKTPAAVAGNCLANGASMTVGTGGSPAHSHAGVAVTAADVKAAASNKL